MNLVYLIKKAKEDDQYAKEEIIEKFLPLIKGQISKYKSINGYYYDDLQQYGIMCLLKAIRDFDIDRSNSFIGYVKWTIVNNFACLCRKENNEKKKASSLNIVNQDGSEIINMLEDKNTVEDIYMENFEKKRILDAIEYLDEEERELFKFLMYSDIKCPLKRYSEINDIPYSKCVYRKKKLAKRLNNLLKNI